jgi:hypothetical protein
MLKSYFSNPNNRIYRGKKRTHILFSYLHLQLYLFPLVFSSSLLLFPIHIFLLFINLFLFSLFFSFSFIFPLSFPSFLQFLFSLSSFSPSSSFFSSILHHRPPFHFFLWCYFSSFIFSLLSLRLLPLPPINCSSSISVFGHLCGLMVRVPGHRSRGPGFDSWRYQIFWKVVGLERGSLSLVMIIEELFQGNSGSGLENRN